MKRFVLLVVFFSCTVSAMETYMTECIGCDRHQMLNEAKSYASTKQLTDSRIVVYDPTKIVARTFYVNPKSEFSEVENPEGLSDMMRALQDFKQTMDRKQSSQSQ